MQVHLTEHIDNLGGLDTESVHAQLVAMKANVVKLANKPAIVTPPLSTNTLMQMFTMPPGTSKLDEVWGLSLAPESIKRARNVMQGLTTLIT